MRHCRTAGGNPKRLPGSAVVRCITRRTGVLPPKPLTDDVLRAADVVITMDTSDSLPAYPGKSYEDWAVEDTVGKSLIEVRRIRDDLDAQVRGLLGRLDV